MALILLLGVLGGLAVAQSCGPVVSGSVKPSIASGYRWQVVATGLAKPRGILLDPGGNLLVVESGSGVVSSHVLSEDKLGCVSVQSSGNVTEAASLNHGIEMSQDGKTLYASNTNESYAWDYQATSRSANNRRTLVTNMTGTDHSTRTLLIPKSAPDILVISFGSQSNLDIHATDLASGSASVKAFNLTNMTEAYSYQQHGLLLGWGLRNEVGVGEHPVSGGIWGVENSADQITRYGVDVHATNPGEELNFLGYLNGTSDPGQGSNFGYPWCFSTWDPTILPQNQNLSVGKQFAIDASSTLDKQNRTDDFCAAQTPPRLVFQSHMAPLDIKFNDTGRQAWITFHGSWNSPDPVGYKLSVVDFTQSGDPVNSSNSTTAARDIFSNQNNSECPQSCFRPVAMAIDGRGRIFVSSDTSGEVYLITQDQSSPGTSTSASPSASPTKSAASRRTIAFIYLLGCLAVVCTITV